MYKGFGKQYSLEIETLMVLNFNRLSEKERCHCASLEVIKLGYGSKTYIQNLFNIGQKYKAGSPTAPTVFGIHLKPREISSQFYEQYQQKVSNGMIKRLLKELEYSYRKMSKTLATGIYLKRDEQFKIIMSVIFAMSLKTQLLALTVKKRAFR